VEPPQANNASSNRTGELDLRPGNLVAGRSFHSRGLQSLLKRNGPKRDPKRKAGVRLLRRESSQEESSGKKMMGLIIGGAEEATR